jgi:hypothetical protein
MIRDVRAINAPGNQLVLSGEADQLAAEISGAAGHEEPHEWME